MYLRGMTFWQIFPFWLWPAVMLAGFITLAFAFDAVDKANRPIQDMPTLSEAQMMSSTAYALVLLGGLISFIVFVIRNREYLVWPTGVLVSLLLLASNDWEMGTSGMLWGAVFLFWGVVVRPILFLVSSGYERLRQRRSNASRR